MESLVAALLRREGRDPDVELSVLFCDDPAIQALNRDYRGIDRPTDVLSFPQEETADGARGPAPRFAPPPPPVRGKTAVTGDCRLLSADFRLLGDVVISLETAKQQAKAQRHALRREVEWLLLHGTLHLLGYDDLTEAGLQSMIARQEAVMKETPDVGRRTPARHGHESTSGASAGQGRPDPGRGDGTPGPGRPGDWRLATGD
jgi:probable rRNA maturation factor